MASIEVLQRARGIGPDCVQIGALQLLPIAEDDLFFHARSLMKVGYCQAPAVTEPADRCSPAERGRTTAVSMAIRSEARATSRIASKESR